MSSIGDNKEGEQLSPSVLGRAVRALAFFGAVISTMLVLTMLAIVSYSVFMRYVLGTPVTWSDELSGYLVIALVMFGAAEALLNGDHFGVDLLTAKLQRTGARRVRIWGLVAVALVGSAILYSAYLMVRFSVGFGMYSEGYLEMPMWIPQTALIIGSVLLIVTALACIISRLANRSDQ